MARDALVAVAAVRASGSRHIRGTRGVRRPRRPTRHLPRSAPRGAHTAQPFEETIFDPGNPNVLAPHLLAAAHELPITINEHVFPENSREVLDELEARGLLRSRPTGLYWTSRARPHDMTDLRGAGDTVRIVEEDTGRLLGTVDSASAHRHVHPGAVYVHQGVSHTVQSLNVHDAVAIVRTEGVEYTTFARDISDIRIIRTAQEWPSFDATMHIGEVAVTSRTVAYEVRALDGTLVAIHDLDLPERTLHTQAVWWTLADRAVTESGIEDLPGAVHAAEHAAIDCCPCSHRVIVGISVECRLFDTRTPNAQRSSSTTAFPEGRALSFAARRTPDLGLTRPHPSSRGAAVAPVARPASSPLNAATRTTPWTRQEPSRC